MCEPILHISFISVSSYRHYGWFVLSQSIYWRRKEGLPVLLDNENLKTASFYKAQLGPTRVTPLLKQLCEKLVLLERIML